MKNYKGMRKKAIPVLLSAYLGVATLFGGVAVANAQEVTNGNAVSETVEIEDEDTALAASAHKSEIPVAILCVFGLIAAVDVLVRVSGNSAKIK